MSTSAVNPTRHVAEGEVLAVYRYPGPPHVPAALRENRRSFGGAWFPGAAPVS